ncbi:MAG: helix-turn-helix domain-containing protein [Clostridia bacterium]|nr:helix-turn-helix domain-containing protein [Clostridia bacterium]
MSNRIVALREEKALTQEALAEKLGVKLRLIQVIEENQHIPSAPFAMKIARIFEKSVEEVFSFEDSKYKMY